MWPSGALHCEETKRRWEQSPHFNHTVKYKNTLCQLSELLVLTLGSVQMGHCTVSRFIHDISLFKAWISGRGNRMAHCPSFWLLFVPGQIAQNQQDSQSADQLPVSAWSFPVDWIDTDATPRPRQEVDVGKKKEKKHHCYPKTWFCLWLVHHLIATLLADGENHFLKAIIVIRGF